ncbi:MAG: glycosyltransferase family 4 protein [Bdellovibrionales bacterium]|nr:glycosyltransferase family 4 protein [Bdellovibrionales bacterium]
MSQDAIRSLIVDFTSTFGGAFEHALSLASELNEVDGVSAGLVSAQQDKSTLTRVPKSVPFFRFPPYRRYGSESGLRAGWRKYFDMFLDVAAGEVPRALRLARIGQKPHADVIHLNNLINIQQSCVLAAKLLGAKSISCHQDFEYHSRLAKKVAQYVDHHVAISQAIKDDLLAFGIDESRITIIHNGIDTNRFSPTAQGVDLSSEFNVPENAITIAIFGRLVPWKGHTDYLKAFAQVARANELAHGLIVGDVSDGEMLYEEELKQLANELGIYDRVTFTGYRADVPEILNSVDIAVHMSNRPEPFGLVVSEAMACGRPIVAMAEGGPLEIVVDGETGFLVPPRNPEAAAEKINLLAADAELRRRFGDAGRERANVEFSAHACAQKYLALYRKLLDEPSTNGHR